MVGPSAYPFEYKLHGTLFVGLCAVICFYKLPKIVLSAFAHLACVQFCSSRRVGPLSLRLANRCKFPELIDGAEPNGE